MNSADLEHWNIALRAKTPLEIIRWAVAQAGGRAVVSTNFRPY
ncbi:MAG: phosphoadenylylsulfate reductase, partial [Opitutae bacterium]|nr:phosphoadenylylsulfate reductase [Opitutae bacterium]